MVVTNTVKVKHWEIKLIFKAVFVSLYDFGVRILADKLTDYIVIWTVVHPTHGAQKTLSINSKCTFCGCLHLHYDNTNETSNSVSIYQLFEIFSKYVIPEKNTEIKFAEIIRSWSNSLASFDFRAFWSISIAKRPRRVEQVLFREYVLNFLWKSKNFALKVMQGMPDDFLLVSPKNFHFAKW